MNISYSLDLKSSARSKKNSAKEISTIDRDNNTLDLALVTTSDFYRYPKD
jgi:hypothetical protein